MANLNPHILTEDPVLGEMVHRLVGSLQPEKIYLFGSRARSNATPVSSVILAPLSVHSDYQIKELVEI